MANASDKLPFISTDADGQVLHCTCGKGTRIGESSIFAALVKCRACSSLFVVKSPAAITPLMSAPADAKAQVQA